MLYIVKGFHDKIFAIYHTLCKKVLQRQQNYLRYQLFIFNDIASAYSFIKSYTLTSFRSFKLFENSGKTSNKSSTIP